MPQWFLRGLRRGVVTTRYPARPDPSAGTLPAPPAFRPRMLTPAMAEVLARTCPSGALSTDGGTLTFDVGACTACGRCRQAAPGAVISSGEFELACTDRSALTKTIPLLGEGA